jgi:predicted nuclease of restriction endonuclease-like (RecB) superfamily
MKNEIEKDFSELLTDLIEIIHSGKFLASQTLNSALVLTYWSIGERLHKDILQEKRAEYGKEIVAKIATKLTEKFGKGFDRANLFRMIQFAETYQEKEIVVSLSRQLSWSHFIAILPLKDDLKRDFYAEMCRIERWGVRTLRKKIDGMLFERTAISKKSDELIREELDSVRENDKLTPNLVFREPYILDFLDLPQKFSEEELEDAIISEIEKFLLELGSDFAFLSRQKRMPIGKEDYYLDLLFYHRRLRRLVAIELTLGKFTPEYFGKMSLYLRWLDKNEKHEDEEPPIGLVLCGETDGEQIELLEVEKENIRVAKYLVELPPRDVLQAKLNDAIKIAKAKYLDYKK